MATVCWTALSRPGPVEAELLERLPSFRVERKLSSGVNLRYLVGGEGAPLVLLHGRGSNGTSFFPLLESLAKRFQVIAVDLPGFGHSAAPPFVGSGGDAGIRYFAQPIASFLDALDLSRPLLCGHSLGGFVALWLARNAAEHQPRIEPRALALLAPMGLCPAMSLSSRAYVRAGPERISRLRFRFGLAGTPEDPSPKGRREALSLELRALRGGRPEASRAFSAMVPMTGSIHHLGDELSKVRAPTLILAGTGDATFPIDSMRSAATQLPRGTFVELDCAHSPHHEATGAVLSELTTFLHRHAAEDTDSPMAALE